MDDNDSRTREQLLAELDDARAEIARLNDTARQCMSRVEAKESFYKSLSDAGFEAVFLSDKGVCTAQNKAARDMFGYSDDEALGRMGTEWIHEDCRQLVIDNITNCVEIPYEAVALRKDGTTFPCEIQARMIDHEGLPVRVTVLRDITERKEAEGLREDFNRMFRHDMRTPLAGILSTPRLLMEEGNLTPFQVDMLQAVEEASYKLLGLLRIAVELRHLEDGTFEPEISLFDLSNLIWRTIRLLEADASARGVSGRVVANEDQDSFDFEGDEVLLFCMISNLYKNALEASPKGSRVDIRLQRAGGQVVIEFRNAGEVPADVRDCFFEKYSTSGKSQGTGLGTYSAMLVAKAHGGDIELETKGGSTHVRVILPQPE